MLKTHNKKETTLCGLFGRKQWLMKVDDSINQICPMCEDMGRIHLDTNFGNATMHNKHGGIHAMHCVYGLVYGNKKPSQLLAPMQLKQCVLHDAKEA